MSPLVMSSEDRAYDHVVTALERRGLSRRRAARLVARLSRRSLVDGAQTLSGEDISYHVAFRALQGTAPEGPEMRDDTHPHVGMPARLCWLIAAAVVAGGQLFAQRVLAVDAAAGRFELGVFTFSLVFGGFFAIKGWIKWLRS